VLKPLTISMFVAFGLSLAFSVGFLMCSRSPTYDIRPEPVERRESRPRRERVRSEPREPVIRADDGPRTYNPLEDM
jgi:hypothetical protein